MIEWTADSSGQWTDMQIELKTGNNLAMVPLKGANFFPCMQRPLVELTLIFSDHHD